MLNVNYNYRDGAFVEITGEDNRMFNIFLVNTETGEGMLDGWNLPVNHWVRSTKKYFVPWAIRINNDKGEEIFYNELSLKGKDVFVKLEIDNRLFPKDTLAELFEVLEKFGKKHECIVHTKFSGVNKSDFSNIIFSKEEDIENPKYFAVYKIGMFKNGEKLDSSYHTDAMVRIWDPTYSIVLIAEDILGLR